MKSVHSNRLERWLGSNTVEHLSNQMRGWYGPPIGIKGVPGAVYVDKQGDFVGKLNAGWEMSALDRADDIVNRIKRALKHASRSNATQLNMGFSSLSALIAAATQSNNRYEFPFNKAGVTGVVQASYSLWGVGNSPPAGADGDAAPAGRAVNSATTGAFPFVNPTGGITTHFVSGYPIATVGSNTLLLYDRLFDVNKTMNSTNVEAVTGVPTRYQSTVSSNPDYIGGNFLFIETGATPLAATAHNWTICTYLNQSNNTANLPSLAGISSCAARRLDMPISSWYAPLSTGDVGIKALTQMQCSALVATGVINFVIGRPIAWLPCPVANMVCVVDGINTAFNLTRIFDNAALSFLEISKPASTSTTYSGSITAVAG